MQANLDLGQASFLRYKDFDCYTANLLLIRTKLRAASWVVQPIQGILGFGEISTPTYQLSFTFTVTGEISPHPFSYFDCEQL
jgi:hypothetical protein